jgi:vacuolar protein sorting-associated protein 11
MFIKNNNEFHYDVDTAIKVCRKAGYIDHALSLAKKNNKHQLYLKIIIEDFLYESNLGNYKRALKHIESLSFDEAEKYMKEYGKILVTKIPKQTTTSIIRLCTNYTPIEFDETDRKLKCISGEHRSSPDTFIQSFATKPYWLMVFLENVIIRNLSII